MKRFLICLLLGSSALAAPGPEFEARYREGIQAANDWRYARARHLADELLRENRDNYAANYLLGRVYLQGDGSAPRAAYCFGRAHELIEKAYAHPEELGAGKPGELFYVLLQDEASALSQVGRYTEALGLIDKLDAHFQPPRQATKGFWLLKMGRADEARALMLKLLKDPAYAHARNEILNNLGAIESETDHLEQSYGYFKQLADSESSNPTAEPVAWHNAALLARLCGRFEESEKLALEATRHFDQWSYSNPYVILAELYVQGNRLPEALDACKTMQAWRLSQNASISQHARAECSLTAALVLMHAGYDREALPMLEELVDHPDRDAASSSKATVLEAQNWFLYECCLQLARERTREQLSCATWSESPALWWRDLQLGRAAARARSRLVTLVSSDSDGGVDAFLQPYGPRALGHPELGSQAWRCFGTGAVVESARRLLGQALRPGRAPYLQASLGEALLRWGNLAAARSCLTLALGGSTPALPEREVALRNRCQALLASIELASGEQTEAVARLQRLLESDSAQIRACGLALPTDIVAESGSGASEAAAALARSPRLQRATGGFRLQLRGDLQVSGELLGPDGTRLGQFSGEKAGTSSEAARSFCDVFHQNAFAPVLDLNQSDMRSIDGSNEVARSTAFQPRP